MNKTSEFIRGQRDCEQGKPHKSGQSKEYDQGYSTQYTLEQVRSHKGFS